ncbi:ABC transporter ATP-binding protein [Aestuariivivens sediminis]|uniref:ABC transporter ATP-binding protein n=1 Tax=Aestuariivivens sediminis TaxID=2913557 RepID=UPI001F57F635|nr:ABC transporter ATP-binding protein [Aestuariivivens sediminis]
MNIVLKSEQISKQYRLGLVGTGTLQDDIKRWWYKIRGKPDPFLKIGDINDRTKFGDSDYVWALQDINFEIEEGEILGIIGKNGAGKSTLLKILSRVTSPTTGYIKTKGRIASLLEVGTGFHPELTGRENIYLNGAILGMTKAEIQGKEDEIIVFSGCERYIDTPVKRYSSGMRVRLAFAVAAFLEPDILVIDEVLAVGDAEFQRKAIGKMQDISKGQGRTVLFVSHNMAAVKSLCTRAVVLEHGKMVFNGSPNDAVDYYLSKDKQSQFEATSLLDRKDRLGNGNWLFSKIILLDKNMRPIENVISGESVYFKIFFKKNKKINLTKIFVGVAIKDVHDHKIASFLSDEMGADFNFLERQNYLLLKIPNLSLRSATYSISLQLCVETTDPEGFVDLIDGAFLLNVLQGDYWETGRINRAGNFSIIPGSFISK